MPLKNWVFQGAPDSLALDQTSPGKGAEQLLGRIYLGGERVDRIEQGVILAAGEGQRLRPFTTLKPKVMIPIANKPILQYVIEALAQNNVRNLVIVVGYRKDQVLDFFGSGDQFGVEISYVVQGQQLGTAHALKQAEERLHDRFLVLSGDNIIGAGTIADLVAMVPNAILVKEQENASKYGVIVARGGVVQDIIEKPEQALSHLVNTGVYTFTREILDFIGEETELPAAIRNMIGGGRQIRAVETSGAWLDVVYPWDILRLNGIALSKNAPIKGGVIERDVTIRGPVSLGNGTIIRASSYLIGPLSIGENCEIGPSVCLLPSTSIGNNVCLLPFTEVKNSVIGDNVEIGPGSTIEDSVIDRGCLVRGHFITQSDEAEIIVDGEYHKVPMGAMLGEHCNIGGNVVVAPGTIVGNYSRVRALKMLAGNIPDGSIVV